MIFGFLIGFAACQQSPKSEESQTEEEMTESTSHDDWSKNATIYEVNVRQYSPEGTLNAVTEDLDRIKDMGIKIIWL
ncbi:MAG: alpha-amylase, partial [Cryomorphaceae bacterium]